MFQWTQLEATTPVVSKFAELALFSVLFTDGMNLSLNRLRKAWRLPGRALLFGLPLTLIGTALLAHTIVGLPWMDSFLLGAVLSPTDPVFASAIVGREEVPERLRLLLNAESGVNDGIVLPIIVIILAWSGMPDVSTAKVLGEVVLGVALGVLVPWVAIRLERISFFSAHAAYEPFWAFSIGLLVYSLCWMTNANEYLAAFIAGVTLASIGPSAEKRFEGSGNTSPNY